MTSKAYAKESVEQICLFRWAAYMQGKYPELNLMYHIPNGGSRNKLEAANLKRQGVKAGVPDICLPVARGLYHGLYIEMKNTSGKNKATAKQKDWIDELKKQGYMAIVCFGWQEASEVIEKYMKGGNKCDSERFN